MTFWGVTFWVSIVASNVGSFLLGMAAMRYLVPRLLRAITRRRAEHPHAKRSSLMRTTARAVVIVLISLIAFGLGVRVGYEVLANKVDCFNTYANDLADSLDPRQNATEQLQNADQAQDLAIVDLLTPGNNDADLQALREATAAKVANQDDLEAQRIKKPYPDPPREVCR